MMFDFNDSVQLEIHIIEEDILRIVGILTRKEGEYKE